jgi:ribosomal protein S18 acetylase RimI-like enzyme
LHPLRSDGVFTATIWDVAVAPAWQRVGLGRAMMERLTRGLVEDGIPNITLYAEPQVGRPRLFQVCLLQSAPSFP